MYPPQNSPSSLKILLDADSHPAAPPKLNVTAAGNSNMPPTDSGPFVHESKSVTAPSIHSTKADAGLLVSDLSTGSEFPA